LQDTTLATGAPIVAVTRPLPEYGWGLVVRTSRSELLAPVRGASWALAGLLGMVGAAATLLAVLVADRLGRPLLGLQVAAHRIEQGDLDAALDADLRRGPAEIRDLGDRFAGMAAALASHRQEQEERYRDLEVLTHAMVHDLKGPLTAAAGLLELVDRDLVTDEEERRLLIHRSLAATGRMQRLIDDLLALLRAIGGPIGSEEVPLGLLVDEAVSTLELTGLVEHEGLPVVLGDRLLLEQMVQNLLHNAASYHRPGCPARIEVSADTTTGDKVTLHVDDDGIGIVPEDRTRLLQTFERGSNVVAGGGTGLGLPIAVRVIERHGGSLTLGDSPLGGTRVSVTLPDGAAQSDAAVV
jgi:signal transduction histidine kinase